MLPGYHPTTRYETKMTASQLRGLVTGAQELVSDLDGMGFAAHLRGGQEGLWHHALDALDAHAARIVEKEAVSAEARNLVI